MRVVYCVDHSIQEAVICALPRCVRWFALDGVVAGDDGAVVRTEMNDDEPNLSILR